MKFSFYSPNQPPQKCGVGDFTYCLARVFQEQGHSVAVFFGDRLLSAIPPQKDSIGVIQYTPYLFPTLRSCFRIFKAHEGKISIFFHELYFPPSFSPRGVWVGWPHFFRFLVLVHLAKKSIFSTAGFYNLWSRRLPYLKKKMAWVPVSSSIPVDPTPSLGATQSITLLHFGGAHPTHLYDFVFAAFQKVSSSFPDHVVDLDLVGVSPAQFPKMATNPRVRFYGYLDAKAVSHRIQNADYFLEIGRASCRERVFKDV